jgi:A/G-specific adenine glycosylase
VSVSQKLLAWYDAHARALPWRAPPGAPAPAPYRVWLSEIMLQQTTTAAVKPYFDKFLSLWPQVEDLAAAPIEAVMKAWAGLGYYSRARNLHAAAQAVAARGGFPQTEEGLRALPGVGPYTAAAIAAIAFDQRAVVVDGNVERVVSRLFAIETPLPAARPLIRQKADAITPDHRAGDFAQAMMDLGATVCTPKSPACAICPLIEDCAARRQNLQAELPRKAKKPEKPKRRGAAFVALRADGMVLLRTRSPKGLLGGMTEPPGTQWSEDFDPDDAPAQAPFPAEWRRARTPVRHVFTHFELTLEVFSARVPASTPAPPGCRWVARGDVPGEALPNVMRKALEAAEI